MDAIAFCLGVDLKDLRVNSLQALCGKQSERVFCQLTFVKGNETVKLAGLITDKQRVYKVNGLKVTKEKLKFTLQHTLGFAKDSVCWLIGQSSVHKIIAASPKSLYDCLTFVSGTHTLLATRDRVQSDMQLLKNQYSVLNGLIQEFESSFQDHKKLIASIEKSGVLKAQLEDLEEKLKSHESHFEHLKHFELYLKLQQFKLDIDACSSEIEKIEEGFNEIEDVDDDTHITETERRLCEIDNDIAQKTTKIADLQAMQSVLEHQFKEAQRICFVSSSELKGFRDSLLAQEVLCKRFRQRLESLDNEIRIARVPVCSHNKFICLLYEM